MEVTPQEIKELKEGLNKVRILGQQIYGLAEEQAREIDILERRLSFMSHPAGKARKAIPDNIADILNKKEN